MNSELAVNMLKKTSNFFYKISNLLFFFICICLFHFSFAFVCISVVKPIAKEDRSRFLPNFEDWLKKNNVRYPNLEMHDYGDEGYGMRCLQDIQVCIFRKKLYK